MQGNKNTSMNTQRNKHWLNSHDCPFLVSMKEKTPAWVQKNRNLARMHTETSTGELFFTVRYSPNNR